MFDVEGTAYTAGANGQIYVWDANSSLDRAIKGHTSEVTALVHENGKLISGGKDNKVIIYTAKTGEYKQEKVIDLGESSARGIDYFNGKILVGLRNGSIYEVNEATEDKKLIHASHHEGEAWGLQVIPETHSIMSIGDDNKLMEFDFESKKFLRKGTIA